MTEPSEIKEFRVMLTAPQMFTPYRVLHAEGERIGQTTCNECGATVTLDPNEDTALRHRQWHWARNEGLNLA